LGGFVFNSINNSFYYKDLADEQKQLITNLWGIKHE